MLHANRSLTIKSELSCSFIFIHGAEWTHETCSGLMIQSDTSCLTTAVMHWLQPCTIIGIMKQHDLFSRNKHGNHFNCNMAISIKNIVILSERNDQCDTPKDWIDHVCKTGMRQWGSPLTLNIKVTESLLCQVWQNNSWWCHQGTMETTNV